MFDDFKNYQANDMTLEELLAVFRPIGEPGFASDSWFVEAATERAIRRIEDFRPYFDGTNRQRIPVS